jgi:hypothetical protein
MNGLFLEIKFEGGLGNQLFQYAAGRSLAVQNNIPHLLLNTDGYKNQPLGRKFLLADFQIKGSIFRNNFLKKIFRPRAKLNDMAIFFKCHNEIEDKEFKLKNITGQTSLLTTLKGYWQSEYYFKNIRQILLEELVPKKMPLLPQWINNQNTVGVHVRRTDYLNEHRYGFVGANYYKRSIDILNGKIDKPVFIFFSDDIVWCKENFAGDNIIFCEEQLWKEDHLQLYLMSKCRHQVIANSSFSWWSAWLNSNNDKVVIRPLNPFKEKSLLYESHYPAEWITVDNDEH